MNNKGFIHIYLLTLLPFFFAILFTSLWMFWFVNQKNKIDNLCHVFLLRSQKELVNGNNRLLSHNFEARSLIYVKRALSPLRFSPYPPVAAAAKAGYQTVISRQKSLAATQKIIINQMNHSSHSWTQRFKQKFVQVNYELSRQWRTTEFRTPEIFIYPKKTQVQITTKDIASVYNRVFLHSHLQTIQSQWKIPLKNFFPKWLENYAPPYGHWEGECSTHPKKQGGLNWLPAIGKGSPF